MRCPLCGHPLDPSALACSHCPLRGACAVLCCPNCGYQIVDESRSATVRLFRRIRRPQPEPSPACLPLGHTPVGLEVEVVDMSRLSAERLERLSTYGLVPGKPLRLLQRHPSPIVEVGETELALERDILDQIQVRPRSAGH
jgi:Fe2+ transport system protein FeoA